MAGHVSGGQPDYVTQRQHHVREVLAHPGASGQRLGGRGPHRGRAVLVCQLTVDEGADLIRLLDRGQPAVSEVSGQRHQLLAGAGERGCPQQARAAQRLGRKPGRAAIPEPFDHRSDPELVGAGNAVGAHADDIIAVGIPVRAAPGGGAAHLHQMRAPVLAAMAGLRHGDQPLAQRCHRLRVLVAEALLEDVRDARGRVQVQAPMIQERRCQELSIDHHATASCATTVIDSSSGPPKVVAMATSAASRPLPMTTRPLRRALLRGSKVHHRSPSQTSIQAAKSMAAGSGGISTSGRYPKTYRAGMFSARQNEMARCVKSRHTPRPEALTSAAVDTAVELPYWNVRWSWTW